MFGVWCLVFGSICYAKIDRKTDSFNESVKYVSYNDLNEYDGITFRKVYESNGNVAYDILLTSDVIDKNDMYSKQDVEIKTNREINKLKVLEVYKNYFEFSRDLMSIRVRVDEIVAEKIKNAERISMRFYKENGIGITLNITDSILAEWKEVKNKEK